ncbi:MAG: 50S ribosomal protein L22 [Candidatus Paceibacterota bacterium]|jgi:large subunit ribosomal protein L22
MAFEVKLKYLKISPRKVRLVADMIRGKKIDEAQAILGFAVKKGADPVLKLLNSAVANVKNNAKKDIDSLFISKVTVDEGPTAKRILPRAKGKADRIMKRSSHVTLVLDEKRGSARDIKAAKKVLDKKNKKTEEKEVSEIKNLKKNKPAVKKAVEEKVKK